MKNVETPFTLGEIETSEKEQLRFLRTNFLFSTGQQNAKVILSCTDKDARIAASAVFKLACALTAEGKSVLVIDVDRKNACASQLLNVETKETFNAYLRGECESSKLAKKTSVEGLSVIFASADDGELLSDDLNTKKLVGALRPNYDFIFLLASPQADGVDIYSYDEFADGVIVLAREKSTTHKFLKNVLEYYARKERKIVGIALI